VINSIFPTYRSKVIRRGCSQFFCMVSQEERVSSNCLNNERIDTVTLNYSRSNKDRIVLSRYISNVIRENRFPYRGKCIFTLILIMFESLPCTYTVLHNLRIRRLYTGLWPVDWVCLLLLRTFLWPVVCLPNHVYIFLNLYSIWY
jgi:hypothetical protein